MKTNNLKPPFNPAINRLVRAIDVREAEIIRLKGEVADLKARLLSLEACERKSV